MINHIKELGRMGHHRQLLKQTGKNTYAHAHNCVWLSEIITEIS